MVVAAPPATVTVSPPTATIVAGATAQLAATPRDAGGNPLTGRNVGWSSSDAAVATVGVDGLVTGISAGQTLITATVDGIQGQAQITVTPAPVSSVEVTPLSASLLTGQSVLLAAIARDASGNPIDGKTAVWTTSAASVATVASDGTVTALGVGTATITATIDGKAGSATISVADTPVASVVIVPGGGTLELGKAALLTAVLRDALGNVLGGRQVAWSTSNAAVVNGYVLDQDAVVVGVGLGSATITATSEGKSASVVVNVVPPTALLACSAIAGASVVAQDGTYLGRLTNKFDSQSIYNPFGTYGSQYSSLSVNNPYGKYGSPYSSYSAFNPYATQPPILVKNSVAIAYFTVNVYKTPYVHPAFAATCNFP
ncbi:MAG: Ig domain-containing protein [Gemmatimonadales bacterium]